MPSAKRQLCDVPMLATYNTSKPIAEIYGKIENQKNHPKLSFLNLAVVFLLRLIQGQGAVWYCSSYTTPANGHDLSLLSGFSVARQLGARYPFPENELATADFRQLSSMMGL